MPITYEESATTGPRAACRACEGSGHAPGYAVRVPCSACRGNGSNPLRGLDDEADERIDALEAEVDRLRDCLITYVQSDWCAAKDDPGESRCPKEPCLHCRSRAALGPSFFSARRTERNSRGPQSGPDVERGTK